ncbi:hypothetical protein ACF1E9_27900 [Streptomyces roseolus]|uniref:hypothetical protein n=1 Tax=Streptomyces roseolus TaxID=67358 RepID=UPI0036FA0B5D
MVLVEVVDQLVQRECLVQAVEYRARGNTLAQDWIDTSLESLKTASARELAAAALTMSPREWRRTSLS